MQIIIHRGTHQIGGVATEIKTATTRIIIDMGDELTSEVGRQSGKLEIDGLTNENGRCDAVLLSHYHGDHVGQIRYAREDIPVYMGALCKDILCYTLQEEGDLMKRILPANVFVPGEVFRIGDIVITPFMIDHSACDNYMFLIEADGKRVLYTGDFRTHGFRGKAIPKILRKLVGKVDVLIIEGTSLSRSGGESVSEWELQSKIKEYMKQYKYVYVYCASTNLERICAFSQAVERGRYFVCDRRQSDLLDLLERHRHTYSPLYRNIKKVVCGDNLIPKLRKRGFLMMVRDNWNFRKIIPNFNIEESIVLYSMWDGYRTQPNSKISDFLDIVGNWKPLHTSGHASHKDIKMVAELTDPSVIIPIHTDAPHVLGGICPDHRIAILEDKELYAV